MRAVILEKQFETILLVSVCSLLTNALASMCILCINDVSKIYAVYHLVIAFLNFMIIRFLWIISTDENQTEAESI